MVFIYRYRQAAQMQKSLERTSQIFIGVRAGGEGGGGGEGGCSPPPPQFGQLIFFGQQEKIWAKPVFKDVFMFI